MNLRKKLAILFLILISSIIVISSFIIYYWFAEYRRSEFHHRMLDKAQSISEILLDAEEIDAKLLKKIEATKPLSFTGENIIVYNYNDQIIYSNADNWFKLSKKQLDQIRLRHEIRYIEKKFDVLGLYYKGQYDRVVVAIAAHDTYGLSKLYKLKIILFSVSIFSIVLVYFSGLFFIGKALNPVATIIKEVDEITISNINKRLSEGNKRDDLAKLAMTFNKMLQRLESSFHLQRTFIANASHELRNPLTSITGQLEVALLKNRTPEEYKSIINSVLEDAVNVNKLADKLLLIAQLSSNLNNIERTKIRIDECLWQSRLEIKKANPDYNVSVIFDENIDDENKFIISGNEVLLKTAFNNLIENACKYSDDKTVTINLSTISGKTAIIFSDKGIGIQQEEMDMIFEPFYRGKNVTGIKGHGIGLSLVKEIITLHNGEISVKSENGIGTEFTVVLPTIP